MDKGFKELLESAVLSEETKTALAEAWQSKLDETRNSIRSDVESELREEFANRFASDKNELVEAMNNMLTDVIRENAIKTNEELKAVKEERNRLTTAIKEAKAKSQQKLSEQLKVVEQFALETLKKELSELSEDVKGLRAQRAKLAAETASLEAKYENRLSENLEAINNMVSETLSGEIASLVEARKLAESEKKNYVVKINEHKADLNKETAKSIKVLENFVVSNLNKELKEFQADRKELTEARVKFAMESKSMLKEARKNFLDRATKVVESNINTHLRKELGQLKTDLVEARQNLFGRKLFEAFQGEFMASYLSDGTQTKKLSAELEKLQVRLSEAENKISEKNKLVESMNRKVALAEERALRERTLNELLSPLPREKREVMEELLGSVKTTALNETFHKYLPTILNEGDKGRSKGRQLLSETPVTAKRLERVVTGDRINRLTESVQAESVDTTQAEILELRRLAGIEK